MRERKGRKRIKKRSERVMVEYSCSTIVPALACEEKKTRIDWAMKRTKREGSIRYREK
jgi:hypothetical protein